MSHARCDNLESYKTKQAVLVAIRSLKVMGVHSSLSLALYTEI
jgi:hypothetical protein